MLNDGLKTRNSRTHQLHIGSANPENRFMVPHLSVACVNIEMSKHLDAVCEFLSRHRPEIVCVQELCEHDAERLGAQLDGARHFFVPMTKRSAENAVTGIGIFSRFPVVNQLALYYRGSPGIVPQFDLTSAYTKSKTQNHMVGFCDVEKENQLFRIGTTHFTWTPDGAADDIQKEDLKALLTCLDPLDEFVLCGDFNFPRGGELFATMARRFKDNIPMRYKTSIDPHLHRAGPLELMIDGVFSTTHYDVSDVELHSGVSDHCAITYKLSVRPWVASRG
jgi:endonuclease/exonuclease/phosphatase family metal-dependent hydrolase